jgi:hypothetical protein
VHLRVRQVHIAGFARFFIHTKILPFFDVFQELQQTSLMPITQCMAFSTPSHSHAPLGIIVNQATSFQHHVLIRRTIPWSEVREWKTVYDVTLIIITTSRGSLPVSIVEDKLDNRISVKIDVNVTDYIVYLW